MKDKEQELRWLCRLQAQLQRRWFELANDAIWMLAGLLGCFAWVGPLAPIGIYVNVALYAYDFFAAALRANLELSRLTKLTKDYEELYAQASADEKLEIAQYQEHLAKRVAFEQKKLLLSVINTGLLTLFICSTIPLIAVNPLVPLMGAAALVLVTICATAALKWLESKKPDDKPVPFFTKLNLFKPLSVNSNAEILLDGPNCHSLN